MHTSSLAIIATLGLTTSAFPLEHLLHDWARAMTGGASASVSGPATIVTSGAASVSGPATIVTSGAATASGTAASVTSGVATASGTAASATGGVATTTGPFTIITSTANVVTGLPTATVVASSTGRATAPAAAPTGGAGNSCPADQNAMCCNRFGGQSGLGGLLGIGCVDLLAGGSCNQQAACCTQQSNGITVLQICQLL